MQKMGWTGKQGVEGESWTDCMGRMTLNKGLVSGWVKCLNRQKHIVTMAARDFSKQLTEGKGPHVKA